MAIVLRNTKGSALTYNELDDNFLFLSSSYVPTSATSSMSVLSSSFATTAGLSMTSSFTTTASFTVSSSVSVSSSFSSTSSIVVSNPYGSRRIYSSVGSIATDMSNLSGSSGFRHVPPGYLTYYLNFNESSNSKTSLFLYPLTTNGTTRRDPLHNSTITIINEGGNEAWIIPNGADFGSIVKRSTSENLPSCSLAQKAYITLVVDDNNFIPNWIILNSGSLF